jgi:hypothetical protein
MLHCDARAWERSAHVSCVALHSLVSDIDLQPNASYPHAFGGVAAHALTIN